MPFTLPSFLSSFLSHSQSIYSSLYSQSWGWNQGLTLGKHSATELQPSPARRFSSLVLLGLTVGVRDAAVCSSTPASMPLHPPPAVPVSRHPHPVFQKWQRQLGRGTPEYQMSRSLHSEFPLFGKHLQTCKGRGWECRMAGASWPCHLFPPPASLSLHTPVWP